MKNLRAKIDEIDEEILELLVQRVEIAVKAGAKKRARGEEICDLTRENEILQRIYENSAEKLRQILKNDKKSAQMSKNFTKIYEKIITACRDVQDLA